MRATSPLCKLPEVVRRAAAAIGDAARTRAGGPFALVEHAWHLADLELEFQVRIRRLRTEREPVLADFDGDAIAAARRYLDRPLAPAVVAFSRARTATIAALAEIRGRTWLRSGTQEALGFVMLGQLPDRILAHDRSHARELAELLAALRPGDPLIATLHAWCASLPVPAQLPCDRAGTAPPRSAAPPALDCIQHAIATALPTGVTTRALGESLGVSARTLQRRLSSRGLTVHCLVEETRRALAIAQLRDGVSLDAVARALGFGDPRALGRAYKRWTGTTPAASRRALGLARC